MDERMFYTREELGALSDLALMEVRSSYQRLHALLEGAYASDESENRKQLEEVLRGIGEEMRACGLTSRDPNRS